MASPPRRPWYIRCGLAVGIIVLNLGPSSAQAGWFDSITKSERADLRLETFSLDKRKAAVGENLIATVEVSNWGNLKAKAARLTFLAAPGATSSISQATRVYAMELGTMGSKLRLKYSATFAVPTWAKTGVYRFFATVETQTVETRRGNNSVATTLDVIGSSPSAAASASPPASISSPSASPSAPSAPPPAISVPTIGAPCDYYASPTGVSTNDGLTTQRPFRPQDFWTVARPGRTLCLMDGTYRGAAYMINPAAQGFVDQNTLFPVASAANRITIRALNDGAVLIDGETVRRPVSLYGAWYIIEGINACCSRGPVFSLHGTDFIGRRLVGWHAFDAACPDCSGVDHMIFENTGPGTDRGLLEDVAGFGRARKIIQPQSQARFMTYRRVWAEWCGYLSKFSHPRNTIEADYNSPNTTLENVLATWSGDCPNNPSDHEGLIRTGHPNGGFWKILGTIGYIPCRTTNFPGPALFSLYTNEGNLLQDTIAVIQPGCPSPPGPFDRIPGFYIQHQGPGPQSVINRTSTWGGSGINEHIGSGGWSQTGVCTTNSANPGAGNYGACSSPFNPTGANARLCKRYVNGVLTDEPLWPWPMDSRIKAAMARAGRPGLDGADGTVTSEIETVLGPIPAACRSDR